VWITCCSVQGAYPSYLFSPAATSDSKFYAAADGTLRTPLFLTRRGTASCQSAKATVRSIPDQRCSPRYPPAHGHNEEHVPADRERTVPHLRSRSPCLQYYPSVLGLATGLYGAGACPLLRRAHAHPNAGFPSRWSTKHLCAAVLHHSPPVGLNYEHVPGYRGRPGLCSMAAKILLILISGYVEDCGVMVPSQVIRLDGCPAAWRISSDRLRPSAAAYLRDGGAERRSGNHSGAGHRLGPLPGAERMFFRRFAAGVDEGANKAGWVVVNLAARLVTGDSTYSNPSRDTVIDRLIHRAGLRPKSSPDALAVGRRRDG
jgi:hypothetical protein